MSIHRTAQGRNLDMAALIAKNEKTRAVGNMKVNARGDTIDGKGNILKPRNLKVTEQYGRTVGAKPQAGVRQAPKMEPVVEDKLPSEHDFDDQDDIEIEQIKQQDVTKAQSKKGKK